VNADQLACLPAGLLPPAGGGLRRGGGGFTPQFTTRDPMYVPVTVTHDGHSWMHVGMRYKGNSSLTVGRRNGGGKLPFRLDFGKYGKDFPAGKNQRFYGFDSLTFSSNANDDSQLREVLASEVLRDLGVPAARAAFYRVYVDTGRGAQYWGLYSMIEDPADGAMLDAQFGSHSGNLYKPEGAGADWTQFFKQGFEKKNHKAVGDYSDVEAAVAALNAVRADTAAWRAALEAHFDVDHFLHWLAVNTLLDNWDVYGAIAHNYYLYADPRRSGKLVWIPWDHNEAFSSARAGGGRGFGRGGGDILNRNAGASWPLLSVLLADPVYAASYRQWLSKTVAALAQPSAFAKRVQTLHALIAPEVTGARGETAGFTTIASADAFDASVDGAGGILPALQRRLTAVRAALTEAL
jgi:spore coat protein H